MAYRVLRGCILRGGRAVAPGATVEIGTELDESLARQLVARGTLVPEGAAPAPPPPTGLGAKPLAAEVSAREPEPEHREPRQPRGGR